MKEYTVKKIEIIEINLAYLYAIVQIWISEKRAIVTKVTMKELEKIKKTGVFCDRK